MPPRKRWCVGRKTVLIISLHTHAQVPTIIGGQSCESCKSALQCVPLYYHANVPPFLVLTLPCSASHSHLTVFHWLLTARSLPFIALPRTCAAFPCTTTASQCLSMWNHCRAASLCTTTALQCICIDLQLPLYCLSWACPWPLHCLSRTPSRASSVYTLLSATHHRPPCTAPSGRCRRPPTRSPPMRRFEPRSSRRGSREAAPMPDIYMLCRSIGRETHKPLGALHSGTC